MACRKIKFSGRDVVLEYSIGCGDQLPQESDWRRIGSMRTKEMTVEWDTIDGTDADSVGSLRENLASFQSLTISGDGTLKVSGRGSQDLIDLNKHVVKPDATGGQPAVWMRMTYPDLTFIAYMLVSNFSRSAPYDDVATYSLEASATASDFGLLVEDTPDPDAPDVTSVMIVPSTLAMTVGESFDFEGVALPAGASQQLRWSSNNTSAVTINPVTGQATAVGAGSATITASAAADDAITATADITVAPIVSGVTVSPTSVSVAEGDTQQLVAEVMPAGAAPGLLYESSDEGVATVSPAGLVTGVAEGSAVITITSAARPAVRTTVPVEVTAP